MLGATTLKATISSLAALPDSGLMQHTHSPGMLEIVIQEQGLNGRNVEPQQRCILLERLGTGMQARLVVIQVFLFKDRMDSSSSIWAELLADISCSTTTRSDFARSCGRRWTFQVQGDLTTWNVVAVIQNILLSSHMNMKYFENVAITPAPTGVFFLSL